MEAILLDQKEPKATTLIKNVYKNIENNLDANDCIPLPEDFISFVDKDCGPPPSPKQEYPSAPWCRSGGYSQIHLSHRLHEEIVDFCKYITPTKREKDIRNQVIARIRNAVNIIWPNKAEIEVYGSSYTGLALPSSDIDLVILGIDPSTKAFRKFVNAMYREDLVSYIEVLDKARIPIIKMTDRETGIAVDICFEVVSGLQNGQFFIDTQKKYPEFRPLVLFLKSFLLSRDLSETYRGGVGSFLLHLLVLSFLQLHPCNNHESSDMNTHTLGAYLMLFFQFYGNIFNNKDVGISVRDGGSYFRKKDRVWNEDNYRFNDSNRAALLTIENPFDEETDSGRNSYNYGRVRSSFAHAFQQLCGYRPVDKHSSILERLIKLPAAFFEIRENMSKISPSIVNPVKVPPSPAIMSFSPLFEEAERKANGKSAPSFSLPPAALPQPIKKTKKKRKVDQLAQILNDLEENGDLEIRIKRLKS